MTANTKDNECITLSSTLQNKQTEAPTKEPDGHIPPDGQQTIDYLIRRTRAFDLEHNAKTSLGFVFNKACDRLCHMKKLNNTDVIEARKRLGLPSLIVGPSEILHEQSRLTANGVRTNQTGLTSTAINGILHKRLERAVKERMVNIKLVEDLRDNGIRISATQFDKYTVVELEFMGCYYHGLTSCNPEDKPNTMEAVGRALTRALNELFAKNRFGDLKRVRVLDKGGNCCLVTPAMLEAMIRGTD